MPIASVSQVHTLHDHISELTALDLALLGALCAVVGVLLRLYLSRLSSCEDSISDLKDTRINKSDFQEFRREVLDIMHRTENKVDARLADLTDRQANLAADVNLIEHTVQGLERKDICGFDKPQ